MGARSDIERHRKAIQTLLSKIAADSAKVARAREKEVGTLARVTVLPSGLVSASLNAGRDLLGWGMETYSSQSSINPTALAEMTYEFCRLYEAIASAGRIEPVSSTYRIAFLRSDVALHLTNGHRPTGSHFLRELELDQDVTESLGAVSWGTAAESIAGTLLSRIYSRFGMSMADNPYLDPSTGDFDPARLVSLDGEGL